MHVFSRTTQSRRFCAALVTILGLLAVADRAAAADAQQPNILFIFADDQAFSTIGALGNEEIETPNLDRLVRRGTAFTHAYNQGGWHGAVCVASRTMLNTGRYLWHARNAERNLKTERAEGRFWSEYLKAAGYDTYMAGKWHVKADAAKAFDVTGHVRGGMPNQTPQGYNRPIKGKSGGWSPYDKKFGGFWAGGTHWSEVLGNESIGFLDRAEQRQKPFFMYLAFNAPHDPRQSPKEFVDKYPLENVALPKNFLPEYPDKDAMGAGKGLRDEKLAPFPRTPYAVKVNRQEYYAIITHMDAQIGRILDRLEELGVNDNTYIFFTADHGLACGEHGLLGKQNLFDHSVRVPFVAVGPGIEAGRRIDAPIYLQDIMPTTLELAGVEKPEHVEFHSLLPLLRGTTKDSSYDALYAAYVDRQRSITVGDYKLILYPKAARVLLFNLKQDPHEMTNLAASAEHEATIRRLFAQLLKLQTEVGDTLDLTAVYPDLKK